MLSILKKSIRDAAYGFTALSVLYTLIMIAVYDVKEGVWLSALTLFCFFPFSLLLSLATRILLEPKLKSRIRIPLNFLCSFTAFFFCFYLPNAASGSAKSKLVFILIYMILYTIAMAVFVLISKKKKTIREKKEIYQSVYTKDAK